MKPIRKLVAVDTRVLRNSFRHEGSYVYTWNLLRRFQKIVHEHHPEWGIQVFGCPNGTNDIRELGEGPGFEIVESSLLSMDRLWRIGGATAAALKNGADLVFSPTIHFLPVGPVPSIVTIHDVTPLKLGKGLVRKKALARFFTWVSAVFSAKCITDSENSRRDLLELYDIPPEKVSVIYLGFDKDVFDSSPSDPAALHKLRVKHGIHRPYLIHHGIVHTRKNLLRLVKAVHLLHQRRRSFDFDLVLAGKIAMEPEDLKELCASSDWAQGRVHVIGSVPTEDLALLVKGASLSVIPSLYEGFCLPLVESMACGVPVIASATSCLPEISGGCLKYFDPLSVEDIAHRVDEALFDQDLRAGLARQGVERAKIFSWERCATETLAAIVAVAENKANKEPSVKAA